jgi:methyltransferase
VAHRVGIRVVISAIALGIVLAMMVGELWLSQRNERILLARGAVEPPDPVYATMRWAYPAAFVAMALEGMLGGREPGLPERLYGIPWGVAALVGGVIFAIGKLVKYWAIATLGVRWTYRVLVLPDVPLISRGPYRLMRHPNYVGVVGELVGMALLTGARWTGPLATIFFSWLLWRRITAENRALGNSQLPTANSQTNVR